MDKLLFPFVSIVGQDDMKRALLLNIVDPGIGGALIKGEKGTAKSTTVRSLAQILPPRTAVPGCPFNCDPNHPDMLCPYCAEKLAKDGRLDSAEQPMRVVELPLSATEDRVAGTLDIEHVLKTGEKKFEPGVLAQANGNLLYVDEVNLLDDHIVDLLLDSAAMGVNYIEREGVSFSHPSRFVLVGTMNPEEGELRPQLLDRFGLSIDVKGDRDTAKRMEVVRRRMAFDTDPAGYTAKAKEETDALRARLIDARRNLPSITVDDSILAAGQLAIRKPGGRASPLQNIQRFRKSDRLPFFSVWRPFQQELCTGKGRALAVHLLHHDFTGLQAVGEGDLSGLTRSDGNGFGVGRVADVGAVRRDNLLDGILAGKQVVG